MCVPALGPLCFEAQPLIEGRPLQAPDTHKPQVRNKCRICYVCKRQINDKCMLGPPSGLWPICLDFLPACSSGKIHCARPLHCMKLKVHTSSLSEGGPPQMHRPNQKETNAAIERKNKCACWGLLLASGPFDGLSCRPAAAASAIVHNRSTL